MAGGVQYHQFEFAYFQHLAIGSIVGVEVGLGVRTKNDFCSGGFGQVEVTRYKIGMEMCFEHILDFRAAFFGPLEVSTNFAEGVNHHSFAFRLDVVGTLCQTSGINLFYGHG